MRLPIKVTVQFQTKLIAIQNESVLSNTTSQRQERVRIRPNTEPEPLKN